MVAIPDRVERQGMLLPCPREDETLPLHSPFTPSLEDGARWHIPERLVAKSHVPHVCRSALEEFAQLGLQLPKGGTLENPPAMSPGNGGGGRCLGLTHSRRLGRTSWRLYIMPPSGFRIFRTIVSRWSALYSVSMVLRS